MKVNFLSTIFAFLFLLNGVNAASKGKMVMEEGEQHQKMVAAKAGGQRGMGAIGVEERKGKTILVVARNWFFSHYLTAVNLVKLLHAQGYTVHFLVGDCEPDWTESNLDIPTVDDGIVQIEVEMGDKEILLEVLERNDQVVWIGDRNHWPWDWLKAVSTRYALAIADVDVVDGLDIFRRLDIADRAALLSVGPLKSIYQYRLGMPLPLTIPAFTFAERGDGNGGSGIRVPNSQRQQQNRRIYEEEIQLDGKHVKEAQIRNLRLVLVNQHPLANFQTRPNREWPSPVKFIGGIHVEQYLASHHKMSEGTYFKDWKCLVLLSFGSMHSLAEKHHFVWAIFKAFSAHPECAFLVTNFDAEKAPAGLAAFALIHKNIHIEPGFVSQLEILVEQKNLHAVITHCGQNTLNEAIYAGVPLICVPFQFDQFQNAAIVEHLGIGKFVEWRRAEQQFPEALAEVLGGKRKEYGEAASRLKDKIVGRKPSQSGVFIDAIDSAIFAGPFVKIEDGNICGEWERPAEFIQLVVNNGNNRLG